MLRFFKDSHAVCHLPKHGRCKHETNCVDGKLHDSHFPRLLSNSLVLNHVAPYEEVQVGFALSFDDEKEFILQWYHSFDH